MISVGHPTAQLNSAAGFSWISRTQEQQHEQNEEKWRHLENRGNRGLISLCTV
jgi:hypothetical protein